jgi:hypothetical protein
MQGCDAHLMRLDGTLRGIRAVTVEDIDVAVERDGYHVSSGGPQHRQLSIDEWVVDISSV